MFIQPFKRNPEGSGGEGLGERNSKVRGIRNAVFKGPASCDNLNQATSLVG